MCVYLYIYIFMCMYMIRYVRIPVLVVYISKNSLAMSDLVYPSVGSPHFRADLLTHPPKPVAIVNPT